MSKGEEDNLVMGKVILDKTLYRGKGKIEYLTM